MPETDIKNYKALIEKRLDTILPPVRREPRVLHQAMRYSVFSGGKRLRPVIVLVSGRMFGVKEEKLLPVACAIELIHNFSLIHDDLPSMDNDDFRRGRLTCHKKFSEPVAILAGDALMTLGFQVLAECGSPALVKETASAIGSEGMAGGQTMDILFKDKILSTRMKRNIDEKKTGRLFHLCFTAPLFFRKTGESEHRHITDIARDFGMAFQIRDDIQDKEGDTAELRCKLTITYERMKRNISYFGKRGELLLKIVDKLYGS